MKPEPVLVALHLQILQQAGLDARGQHAFAFDQRHFGIDEGQRAVGGRHEVLAADDGQQAQHTLVQHIPGADLLFDHVETGLFDVHATSSVRMGAAGKPANSMRAGAASGRRRGRNPGDGSAGRRK
jgi:hypothetical protein